MSHWKRRNNIVYKKLSPGKEDTHGVATKNWVKGILREFLDDFKLGNVSNVDETSPYIKPYSIIIWSSRQKEKNWKIAIS